MNKRIANKIVKNISLGINIYPTETIVKASKKHTKCYNVGFEELSVSAYSFAESLKEVIVAMDNIVKNKNWFYNDTNTIMVDNGGI